MANKVEHLKKYLFEYSLLVNISSVFCSYFYFLKNYLFLAVPVFVALWAFLCCIKWGHHSLLVVRGLLIAVASLAVEHRLEGVWASVAVVHGLLGMWDLPRPGVEPVSTALAGGFFTIEPSRKPSYFYCIICTFLIDLQEFLVCSNTLSNMSIANFSFNSVDWIFTLPIVSLDEQS